MYKLEKDYQSRVNFYDEKGIFNDPPERGGKKLFKENTAPDSERSFGVVKKEKPVFVRKQVERDFKSQIGEVINNDCLIGEYRDNRMKRPEGVRDVFSSQIKNLLTMK
jgi:hypothetical protein